MGLSLRKLSLVDDLAWEAEQSGRNEFFRGEIFAMVGGWRGHGRIVANLMRHLGNHLDDTPFQAFSDNMKVQIGDDAVLYPDVFVTCDKTFSADESVFTAPVIVIVIEVLSPSTQRYDRSEKFAIYRRLRSLREYVLIDPDTRRVELYRRHADGTATFVDPSERGSLVLDGIDCKIEFSAPFKGMDGGASAPDGS